MEDVLDKLIAEVDDMVAEDEFIEGIGIIETPTKLDDPGIVTVQEYPYWYVAPVMEEPTSETIGAAGYDVRVLTIQVGFVINASDYFDPTVSELPGTRELVRASSLLRKRLRRLSKRNLDDLSGVRNVVIQNTNYVPDLRDTVFVRVAITTVLVERQYAHEV